MGRRARVAPEEELLTDHHMIMVYSDQTIDEEAFNREITPIDELHEFFYSSFPQSKWVIGFEKGLKSKKWHYHATLWGVPLTRETLRARVKKFFKCKNKELAIGDIKNPDTVVSYTVKGGVYMGYGVSDDDLEEAFELSYDKVEEKKDFKKVLKELEEEYLRDNSAFQLEDFVEKYIQTYLDYCKPIYLSHIKARLITLRLVKSPERLKGYVRGILDDLGLGWVSSSSMEYGKSYPQL